MASDRKLEHIQLALESQTKLSEQDLRFNYEPLLAAHPENTDLSIDFLGKKLQAPIWVSSMTGGTGVARSINGNIARACREFGMGMGLGSCRKILFNKNDWADFDFRNEIGDQPFWANLGVAQVEELLASKNIQAIIDLVGELRADGLIVHVNPLQEWFQPEGNRLKQSPLQTIQQLLDQISLKVIVKEVGQGFGPESLRELLALPIEAIEFGAYGGTNFSKLEMLRDDQQKLDASLPFAFVGQSASQMVDSVNQILKENPNPACRQLIISGGIQNALDGYYLTSKSQLPAVFGMASAVLKHASENYESLQNFLQNQIQVLSLAKAYLKINPDYHG
ncbi:isopentenyl-diphosphate delta-isomerase, FMN-dependent [Aquipluma nitroreducens]|uniref:Isopentenyl-diphosphate delta-isomerase, FMN-dependent n=1 Tax=Aquipluma nitroreducens TaxID=2010828 RepID=A0A5K7S7Z9_9BACT|nr:isopentenyl-diphosphate delta-isomerase [Aquipluma nitroreducens]BBE17688.1 isopentenyl-diphosphate delta-isomerase, FMN-dependent [Aquipluma nitroreducens]